jgi:hypothetical protein
LKVHQTCTDRSPLLELLVKPPSLCILGDRTLRLDHHRSDLAFQRQRPLHTPERAWLLPTISRCGSCSLEVHICLSAKRLDTVWRCRKALFWIAKPLALDPFPARGRTTRKVVLTSQSPNARRCPCAISTNTHRPVSRNSRACRPLWPYIPMPARGLEGSLQGTGSQSMRIELTGGLTAMGLLKLILKSMWQEVFHQSQKFRARKIMKPSHGSVCPPWPSTPPV